jgi:molybdate transport system substrate-binding protein
MRSIKTAIGILLSIFSASLLTASDGNAQSQSTSARQIQIRVLSAVGMRRVLQELEPKFERATRHDLKILFDSGAVIEKRIENGEKADVVILPRPSIDRLLKTGRLRKISVADLAASVVGVAVRKGSLKPDISSPDAFKLAMLNAKSIACPDPALGGASGTHIAKVFERLGIASELRPKLVLVSTPDQEETMPGHVVTNGKAEIALHQMQELISIPNIEIVGPLPGDLQATFLFSAAIMTEAEIRGAAQSFVDFLTTPEARSVIKSLGMEPAIRTTKRR